MSDSAGETETGDGRFLSLFHPAKERLKRLTQTHQWP